MTIFHAPVKRTFHRKAKDGKITILGQQYWVYSGSQKHAGEVTVHISLSGDTAWVKGNPMAALTIHKAALIEYTANNEKARCKTETETIPSSLKQRLLELEKRAKRGEYLSPGDMEFLIDCNNKHPELYAEIEAMAFEATKPFGAFYQE